MAYKIKKTSALTFYLFLLVGIFVVVFIPPVLPLGLHYWDAIFWKDTTANSMLGGAMAFVLASMVLRRFEAFPQKNSLAFLFPIALSAFGLLLTTLLVLRLSYSIQIIVLSLVLTLLMLVFEHMIITRNRHARLLLVPFGEALSFSDTVQYSFITLKKPQIEVTQMDGVVADMHSDVLTPDWERFLSNCALKGIPVYNAMQLKEALTGKVNVKHLIANNFGDLSPSFFHQNFKRVIDIIFLIIASPIIVPVMLILAVWISLDSPGGPFYIQPRMGLGGNRFNLVKFRSMFIDHEGGYFTEEGEDYRITRVG
jgi:hypothetical protein